MRWRERLGLSTYEALLTLTLIAVLSGVFMNYAGHVVREARETALKAGLGNIRFSVKLYQTLNGRYPGELKDLLAQRFLLPSEEGTIFSDYYLRAQALDDKGFPIDPFVHRFQYDPAQGRIVSTTKGYETW